jgi:hypothetical protein
LALLGTDRPAAVLANITSDSDAFRDRVGADCSHNPGGSIR